MNPIDAILTVVSADTGIAQAELLQPNRGAPHLSYVRQLVYWLHGELTGDGPCGTAKAVGRTHPTVMEGIRAIERRRKRWHWFARWCGELLAKAQRMLDGSTRERLAGEG